VGHIPNDVARKIRTQQALKAQFVTGDQSHFDSPRRSLDSSSLNCRWHRVIQSAY
jgi:hypothetical protein